MSYITQKAKRQLAVNIDSAILDADISYSELSRRTGIAHTTIMSWGKAKLSPSAIGLVLIANALNIPITQLYEGLEAKHDR